MIDPNIALGKPTKQISTYTGDPGKGNSSLAVDGKLTEYTHTDEGESSQQWWIVDLEKSYTISEIIVHLRDDRGEAIILQAICILSLIFNL